MQVKLIITGFLAAFLALGRPVITEDTSARRYLPRASGFRFVSSIDEAEAAVHEVLTDWTRLSKQARDCAVESSKSGMATTRVSSGGNGSAR